MTWQVPVAYQAHLDSESPTLGHLLKLTRQDGAVYAFTSAGEDVTIEGVTFGASQGLAISSISTSAGMGVDNLELSTIDDGTLFTRADILGGLWQNAAFVLYRYNWASPSDGVEPLLAGTIGGVGLRSGVIVAELRGLQQYLQQTVGNVTTRTCRARFADYPSPAGSNRCRLSASNFTDSPLTVLSVEDARTFVVTAGTGYSGPPWSQVSLLIHCDGSDGSTTFTDSSSYAATLTATNASVGTSNPRFGSGSAVMVHTSSGNIRAANAAQFDLGTGDFTIEFQYYPTVPAIVAPCTLYDGRAADGTGAGPALYVNAGALTYFANGADRITGTFPSLNTWHHVAISRANGSTRLFVDGVQQGSTFNGDTVNHNGMTPRFGSNFLGGTGISGNIDEIRILKGTGLYTANFTPPTQAFPEGGGGGTVRPEDWYSEGVIRWLTGANAGQWGKVRSYTAAGRFVLQAAPPSPIQAGDTLMAVAGCRKRLAEDCKTKFNNVLNFQGEPHLPGIDRLTALRDVSV